MILVVKSASRPFQSAGMCLQGKLQSWSMPFREAFSGHAGVHWFELSLVESMVRYILNASDAMPRAACVMGVLGM